MGADIYLRSVHNRRHDENKGLFEAAAARRDALTRGTPEYDAAQAEVDKHYDAMYAEGYFRDSYNSTSLFALLGLSWWRSCDKGPDQLINSKGQMGVRAMRRLRKTLEDHGPISVDGLGSFVRNGRATIDDDKNSPAAWAAMFERKRLSLIALLGQAIDLREPLDCSV